MANYQTIYALSTGSLPSAIAVVRVSGPSTQKVLKLLVNQVPKPRKLMLKEIKTAEQEIIDIALVCFFPKTESITGEDLAEFHVHGSVSVVEGLYLSLAAIKDVRPAEPGEFTRRSLNNGKMDLIEVEALSDLIASETKEQRKQSLRQLSGELSAKYEEWRKKLIRTRAETEAILDFSDEEDVNKETESLNLSKSLSALIKDIDLDLEKGVSGVRLRTGLKIVLIGAPNVGKSSLINILLKEERAIVSPEAGTTRDIIEARLNLEGIPVTIFDTAGIRKTDNSIEEEGVQRTEKATKAADIIVSIREPEKKSLDLSTYNIEKTSKVVKIVNKIDLIKGKETLFPDPVVPAIRRWGIFDKSVKAVLPRISEPSPIVNFCSDSRNSLDDNISLAYTAFRCSFGTSIPTTDFPGIGATILTLYAERALARSSDKDTIFETFTPGAGENS